MSNTPSDPSNKPKRRYTGSRLHCDHCGENLILSPGDSKYQNCLSDFARWAEKDD
jgi:hypothetical protein